MTEGTKTGSLAAVVGIVVLLAWFTSNGNRVNSPIIEMVGKPLFEKFTDPLAAASLKILRYDTPKEDYIDFEVARDRKFGLWTIPSHESYPADAGKQMSEAANLFVGLNVLGIATEKKSEQALFGVVEPNKQNSDQGGEGVGMLVQMRDEKGDMLTDVIIGKEIDKKKRYVRVPSEDVIYVVELDIAPLSTDFKQWIEPDLLKLSSNDIETLGVRDYQIMTTQQGLALSRNYEADLNFATASGQWEPTRITSFESDPPTERALTPEEQLNATKLNEMKNTLDNLKIADVIKKPAGLAADLRGDSNLLKNSESLMSLQRRGFFPNPNQKGGESIEFYSKSGELVVTLKDGVQYILRFGGAAGAEINTVDATDEKEEGKTEETVSINRFMLVTTRVDESKFPEPDLERLPETVEELKEIERLKMPAPAVTPPSEPKEGEPKVGEPIEGEPKATEPAASDAIPKEPAPATEKPSDPPAAEKPASEKPASEPAVSPEEPKAPEKPAAPEKPQAFLTRGDSPAGRLVAFQDPSEEKKPDAPAKADEPAKADAPVNADAPAKADAPVNADAPAKPQEPAANAEPTEDEWKERLEATRERITKENQRKIDQKNDKLKAAKNKVAELNGRFADWYYVVSESDYKKLKIAITELIQPKTAGGAGVGAPQGGFPGQGAFPGFQP